MKNGNGDDLEWDAQGVVMGIVLFAVAAVVTGFCAKYLFDWATGNLVTENSSKEVLGGLVVGVVGLVGLYTMSQLLRVLYNRLVKK